jgi:hypothetical protein
MTQQAIVRALQNGSFTSQEIENLTGIPRTSIVAACKKMLCKKEITSEKVKVGRSWVNKYTLEDRLIMAKKPEKIEEPRCLLNPFDIRNAKGIFTKAEYAVMNAQARRLFGNKGFANDITNNQFI